MCLQCSAKSISYGTALEGFVLQRATEDAWDEWKKDQFGLVECNDPTFVFRVAPMREPYGGLSDDEVDAVPLDSPLHAQQDAFYKVGRQFREDLCASLNPDGIHRLIESGRKQGYDRDQHGSFEFWLSDFLAKFLETHVPICELCEVPLESENNGSVCAKCMATHYEEVKPA
jgi:hypothetical protein